MPIQTILLTVTDCTLQSRGHCDRCCATSWPLDRNDCAHNRLAQQKQQSAPPADRCTDLPRREVLPFSRTHSAEWERRKQEVRHAHANGMAIDPNDCRRKGGGATRHLALQRDQRWGRASSPFDPTLQIAGRISSIILSCNVASKFDRSPTDAQEKLTSMEHKTSRVRLKRGNLISSANR